MKIKLWIIALLLFYACSVQDTGPRSYSWGSFSAKMNGRDWGEVYPKGFQVIKGRTFTGQFPPVECVGENYSISLNWYNAKSYHREVLLLKKIPLLVGKHKVIPYYQNCDPADPVYGILYTSIDDGDVSGDGYNVLPTADNFVQVDSYNASSKEIKGKFQLTLVLERKGSDHFLPDTLRFTNGVFHTKIVDTANNISPW